MSADINELNLATLTQNHPYIEKIKAALEKASGQDIVLVEVGKVKRVSGVSAVPVNMVFSGHQKLELFCRQTADVFKATLNGKTIPLFGDFSGVNNYTFNNGIDGVAKLVREGQSKFEANLSKQVVKVPLPRGKTTPRSPTAQLNQLAEQETVIDKQIADQTAVRDQLLSQIQANKTLLQS